MLTSGLNLEIRILEVDESSLFREMTLTRKKIKKVNDLGFLPLDNSKYLSSLMHSFILIKTSGHGFPHFIDQKPGFKRWLI
jgi:hypothetical protein